ncbi:hypothetical protein DM02DRAFT_682800 [Periconia macrospinosa]|uniref:Uncharacterized protein n=1 Tax=Periconia macrospinosa TaxID=97972 RepID=A0A2V1E9G0_9PLEO|nr:hypothetical protein DM02DRAFT_682800 [Periconia macrospinosa]
MSTDWIDCRPERDHEAWTMPLSDERRQLLEDIAGQLDRRLRPEFWAFLQVGDLGKIRKIADPDLTIIWDQLRSFNGLFGAQLRDSLLLWMQRRTEVGTWTNTNTNSDRKRTHSKAFSDDESPTPRPSSLQSPASETRTRSGVPMGTPEGSVRHDDKIADLSKQRDGNLCVITKMSAIDACHIYPWCAFGGKSERVANFWTTLRYFWPDEKVEAWRRKIFPDDSTRSGRGKETVENMVTFTATVHRFHSQGAFALRPVRKAADNTQLELEFHWLKRQVREKTDTVDIMEPPMSSRDLKLSEIGEFLCRWDGDQSPPTQLFSGYRFTMVTDDCEKKPLPDTDLLELQWHLQRIFAMSGAAGWKEEEEDDDNLDHRWSSSWSDGSDDHGEGWYS